MTTSKFKNSLPPAAIPAPGLQGAPPLPVGTPMILKNPSPGERAVLQQYGWIAGDPVPHNLSEIIALAQAEERASKDLDNMLPPVDINTKKLELPAEKDIRHLPESEQEKYLGVIADYKNDIKPTVKTALDIAKKQHEIEVNAPGVPANASVNSAIQAASSNSNDIDIKEDNQKDSDKSKEDKLQYCRHCGFDLERTDVIEVTDEDKTNYLISILSLKVFSKQYSLFGGRLCVKIKNLTPTEVDACYRQLYLDKQDGQFKNFAEEAEALARYRASLQISSITGPGINRNLFEEIYNSPLANMSLAKVAFDIFKAIDTSESLHRILLGLVMQFNILVSRLEANVDNSDFWQAIN